MKNQIGARGTTMRAFAGVRTVVDGVAVAPF